MVKGFTSRHVLVKTSTYKRGINMGTKKDKKKKKFWPILLIAAFVISLVACSDDFWEDDYSDTDTEYSSGDSSATSFDSSESTVRGLNINVNNSTGELRVTRSAIENTGDIGDAGVWTIFVYLCGTDLESDYGSATDDMEEMSAAANSDNVRFVVETGGTNTWYNWDVTGNSNERFLIQNGSVTKADEVSRANMGSASTLSDFLTWGVNNYASEHMGVILWNHGGGSITGVCFDETANNDSLSLAELDEAFNNCCVGVNRKFDFIGFDACLMGTIETANILATYADYMYGSEESEPGNGWDYTEIGNYLAGNPGATGLDLGRVVCDSFLASCEEQDDDDIATLSVIDLGKIDAFLESFNNFSLGLYNASSDDSIRAEMFRAIEEADNFGGNNRTEGYTNMVDLGGIINACSGYAEGASEALSALEAAVSYKISGSTHRSAYGLSIYYPLCVQGSEELSIWSGICVSPYYLSFVDRQNQCCASGSSSCYDTYDCNQWFDEYGEWSYGWLFEGESCSPASCDSDYWNYLDDYGTTGESPYITFTYTPQLDDCGSFWFQLDSNGCCAAADVYAMVSMLSSDGEDIIQIGETYDINGDWSSGLFYDNFDGYWLSLPDGQTLSTYLAETGDDYFVYTSPILLNGEETNLRIRYDYNSSSIYIEGAWDGIDENGASSREIVKLKDGDVITPLYFASGLDSDEEFYYYGDEYTISGEPEILYQLLADGNYFYCYCIDDIYGDYYLSEIACYYVEGENVEFYDNMD